MHFLWPAPIRFWQWLRAPGKFENIQRVAEDKPRPLTVEDFPLAMQALGQCIEEINDQREQQEKAAGSAA